LRLLGLERIELLRSKWMELAREVVNVCSEVVNVIEAYVFGSVIKGYISGVSDLDILLVVPNALNPHNVKAKIYELLEDRLGELSLLVDIHIVNEGDVSKPPYTWYVKNAVKILEPSYSHLK